MYKLYCRSYQGVVKIVSNALSWREPELLEGENSLIELPGLIKKQGIESVLIITDEGIVAIGLLEALLKHLQKEEVKYVIYDKTMPNTPIENIEEAVKIYKENNCQGIIAFGGWSPIDCAKVAGARIVQPNKSIHHMKGLSKIKKKLQHVLVVHT